MSNWWDGIGIEASITPMEGVQFVACPRQACQGTVSVTVGRLKVFKHDATQYRPYNGACDTCRKQYHGVIRQ